MATAAWPSARRIQAERAGAERALPRPRPHRAAPARRAAARRARRAAARAGQRRRGAGPVPAGSRRPADRLERHRPGPASRTSGGPGPSTSWTPGCCWTGRRAWRSAPRRPEKARPGRDRRRGRRAAHRRGRATGSASAVLGTDGLTWVRPLAGRVAAHRALRTARPAQRHGRRRPSAWPRPDRAGAAAPAARAAGGRLRPARPGRRDRAALRLGAPLRRLAARHDVIVVEVLDPRELELPAVGQLVLVDPESRPAARGEHRRPPAARPRTPRRRRTHRAATAEAVRAAGAAHLLLRTDSDWVGDLARFVRARRRAGPARRPPRRNR